MGASAEERERLFREAEAGMNQLVSRVESRAGQNIQRTAPPQSTSPTAKQPAPLPTPATPSTREAAQSPSSKEKEVPVSPAPLRTNIASSMSSTTVIPGDTGDSLKLPQFIQYIKDSMSLTPKQAMELLNVKTLSGLNYREAIEQLQQQANRDIGTVPLPTLPDQTANEAGPGKPEGKRQSPPPPLEEDQEDQVASSPAAILPPFAAPNSKHPDIKELQHAVLREVPPPAYGFDEEENFDFSHEEEMEGLPELTVQERAIAENVLSRLKEARGSNPAGDTRLKVLKNVVGDQLSNEQLLELIQGVWGIASLKKLKNDQVEALISWAKEDDFVNEAEIVLAVLQEGEYARSDR